MENKQTEKSQAELYREERKQRMAKAAKKNSKKSPQLAKVGHAVSVAISVLVVVAICLVALYACLNFFGIPQKILPATKINGQNVSIAKYNYYYMSTYANIHNQSSSYDAQYGEGMGKMYTGYDYKASPIDQKYVGTLEGYTEPTWADAFKESALMYIKTYEAYAKLAKENDIKLTDDQKSTIDERIDDLKKAATESDYSLNRYLAKRFGAGVDEKLVRTILEEQFLAENFAEAKQEEFINSITEKDIKAEYKKNPQNYTTFDISIFAVDAEESKDEAAAMKAAKAKADSYLEGIKDAATALEAAKKANSKASAESVNLAGTSAKTIKSSYGDKVVEWIFAKDRAVGDKAVIEIDGAYAVVYLSSLPVADNTKGVDVRHILIAFPTDDEGKTKTLTDAQKKTYKDKAQAALDEYLKNPTEDNFAAVSTKYNEDPGSKENGGLYENVYPGKMVESFNDWIFDPARKPADTGIVETNYGYHVMYYVNNDNDTVLENACKEAISSAKLDEYDKEVTGGANEHVDRNDALVNWACDRLEKIITTQYISYSKNK